MDFYQAEEGSLSKIQFKISRFAKEIVFISN